MTLAAQYPPALCAAILRGIAAQHARGGRALPERVARRLDQGRAVVNLGPSSSPCASAQCSPQRRRRRRTARWWSSTTRTS
eukprot:7706592-Alexandrium_andersonii.AAC.1